MLRKLWFNLAYLQKPAWDTGISPPELLDFITTHPPGRALDLGCGTGTNVITLAQHGWQVTGVDFSGRAIRKAGQKAKQSQVTADFLKDDVTQLEDMCGTFDLILDIGCFHSLPAGKHGAYITNIRRLLAENGTYLLYTFIKSDPNSTDPGATQEDLQLIDEVLHIVERKDGTERSLRPSAWLTIMRRKSGNS